MLIEDHEEAFINYLSEKGVGVQPTAQETYLKESNKTDLPLICSRIFEIIASDRDNVEKGKKAFVSYIRAYKEHDLRYIFEFKNIDIGKIANSFFLFRIPRVKEILGRSISSFEQNEIDVEKIPWLDKNQQLQFEAKSEHRQELRAEREKHAKSIVDIKNVKSKREKVRRRNLEREGTELNKMHKEILKDKRGKSRNNQIDSMDDEDEDTEQIEKRIVARQEGK